MDNQTFFTMSGNSPTGGGMMDTATMGEQLELWPIGGEKPIKPQYKMVDAQRMAEVHKRLAAVMVGDNPHDILDLSMAATVGIRLAMETSFDPFWLLLVAPTSAGKTAVVELLNQSDSVRFLDETTMNGFASGYKEGEKEMLGTLPDLNGRGVIFPDFGATLSKPPAIVDKMLGFLTAAYNGKYRKMSGNTYGVRTYDSWMGLVCCITPQVLRSKWNDLSKLGYRFLYYRTRPVTVEQRAHLLDAAIAQQNVKAPMNDVCRLVAEHVESVGATIIDLPFHWTKEYEDYVKALAELIALGRSTDHANLDLGTRVFKQLWVVGRALTRLYGTNMPTLRVYELLRAVAVSSLPDERRTVLEYSLHHPHGLTLGAVNSALKGDRKTMSPMLGELEKLQIFQKVKPKQSTFAAPEAAVYVPQKPVAAAFGRFS